MDFPFLRSDDVVLCIRRKVQTHHPAVLNKIPPARLTRLRAHGSIVLDTRRRPPHGEHLRPVQAIAQIPSHNFAIRRRRDQSGYRIHILFVFESIGCFHRNPRDRPHRIAVSLLARRDLTTSSRRRHRRRIARRRRAIARHKFSNVVNEYFTVVTPHGE